MNDPISRVTTDVTQFPEPVEAVQQAPDIIAQRSWAGEANREAALQLLTGLLLADQLGLDQQVDLYWRQFHTVLSKDKVEGTAALVAGQTGYLGVTYYHPDRKPLPEATFYVTVDRRTHWVYKRMEDFAGFIPPHALQVLAVVANAGIKPDAYWVADQQEQQETQQARVRIVQPMRWRSVDPVLCCQFDRYFVAIAEWL